MTELLERIENGDAASVKALLEAGADLQIQSLELRAESLDARVQQGDHRLRQRYSC